MSHNMCLLCKTFRIESGWLNLGGHGNINRVEQVIAFSFRICSNKGSQGGHKVIEKKLQVLPHSSQILLLSVVLIFNAFY